VITPADFEVLLDAPNAYPRKGVALLMASRTLERHRAEGSGFGGRRHPQVHDAAHCSSQGAAPRSGRFGVGAQPALDLGALFVVALADDAQVGHSLQRDVGKVARYRGGIEWL
jgi:hypothetical protein